MLPTTASVILLPPLPRGVDRQVGGGALLQFGDGVLLGDVNQLVAEHAGQLRFALHQRERALGDVHEAARRRERVDRVGVEHDERPRQVRPRAVGDEHRADQRDVPGDLRTLDDAEALAHLVAHLLPEFDLLGFGEHQIVRLLRELGALAKLVHELRGSGRGRRRESARDGKGRQRQGTFHEALSPVGLVFVSSTSKISTGTLLPLTVT